MSCVFTSSAKRLLLTVSLALFPALLHAETRELQQALNALDKREYREFNQLRQQLSDHPLHGYLNYRYLIGQLDQLSPEQVRPFTVGWGDTPWGVRLQHRWLLQQGRDKNWTAFLQVQDRPPKSTELRCFYYRAHAAQGDQQQAFTGAKQLWLSGKSQPKSCDPLFDRLKKSGQLSQQLIDQRFQLALARGNLELMGYLKRLSSATHAKQHQAWMTRYRQPHKLAKLKAPEKEAAASLKVLQRWLQNDTDAALKYWATVRGRFSQELQSSFEIKAASYLLARYRLDQEQWLSSVVTRYKNEEPELLTLGVRAALTQANWERVALLTDGQSSPYFRYWRLRALEELGRISQQGLKQRLATLTQERSFHALQAAERSQQPFTPVHQHTWAANDQVKKMRQRPEVLRVAAFIDEGLVDEARSEWEYLLLRLNQKELAAAAHLAKENQWAYLGIRNAVKGGFFDDLELRFPRVFSEQVAHAARTRAIDHNLVYAIARQESAFWPKARSHVGARGLMQLMPATAKETAKRWDLPLGSLNELYQPETNLLLGSSYLAGLLKRFDGDTARAAAAYNAGPHRVKRWDNERGELPIDAWVETIPFKETRNYVQNVLVYQAIYSQRHDLTQLARSANRTQKSQAL